MISWWPFKKKNEKKSYSLTDKFIYENEKISELMKIWIGQGSIDSKYMSINKSPMGLKIFPEYHPNELSVSLHIYERSSMGSSVIAIINIETVEVVYYGGESTFEIPSDDILKTKLEEYKINHKKSLELEIKMIEKNRIVQMEEQSIENEVREKYKEYLTLSVPKNGKAKKEIQNYFEFKKEYLDERNKG